MKLELKPLPAIATFWARVDAVVQARRKRKGRPRIEDDELTRELYKYGCEVLRQNPRMTVDQMVPHLHISRSQWFRWRAKLS